MYITIRMSNGKKITADESKLNWFTPSAMRCNESYPDLAPEQVPEITEGCITINLDHVMYMRPAYDHEVEHNEIHGW